MEQKRCIMHNGACSAATGPLHCTEILVWYGRQFPTCIKPYLLNAALLVERRLFPPSQDKAHPNTMKGSQSGQKYPMSAREEH